MQYEAAFQLQRGLVEQRKRGEIADQLLIVEHPHVVTMGRNGRSENLLASPELMARAGIDFQPTDRGGDVTYHGPGQIVGYPIFDLREWKRDVIAYVRGLEDVIIDVLGQYGIEGDRLAGATGVWVDAVGQQQPAKVAAIGVHVSRWVTSHGFALNLNTDLNYFRYIVPCGLTKPVTSMQTLGCLAERGEVVQKLSDSFGRVFGRTMQPGLSARTLN
jgi:lipoyl(octanoyl) transferase